MSGSDLALVLATVALLAVFVFLVVVLAAVLRGLRDVRDTLDAVRARGSLNCGVGIGTAGFMLADSQGIPVERRGAAGAADACRGA